MNSHVPPFLLPILMTLFCALIGWLEDRADDSSEGQEADTSQPLPGPPERSGAGFEALACRTDPPPRRGHYDLRLPRKQTWK